MSLVWHVRLAEQAEFDLLDIAIWTAENFGPRQAESYVERVTLAIESCTMAQKYLGPKPEMTISGQGFAPCASIVTGKIGRAHV